MLTNIFDYFVNEKDLENMFETEYLQKKDVFDTGKILYKLFSAGRKQKVNYDEDGFLIRLNFMDD